MSRLTGTDAYGLMEAYNNVYAPQELTEEQVWEEVETWVNSLIEEGYDLSEYTWEEMYESYIEEMGRAMTTGQMTAPKVAPTPTSRPQVAGGGMGGMRGSGRDRNATQTSSSPGALRVPPKVGPKIVGPAIVGPKIVGPGKVGPGASPRQQPASAPAARPSGGTPASPKVVPKPTATTTPSGGSALDQATAAASKPAAFSPKPQSDVGGMIARSQARQAAQTPKPATSTATAKPTPRQARLNMEMEYDTYDTVLEHLVSEGYVDTEESALVIMANMSEEWREEILDEANEIMSITSPEGKRKKVNKTYPSARASQNSQNYRKLGALQKRQLLNPNAMGPRAARMKATDEVETNTRKSISRLNAAKNIEDKQADGDYENPIDHSKPYGKSGYMEVPTDYRARRRRASGR